MREGAKVISLRQLLLARNHSEIHYLPADPLTCTSIWPPPRLAAFLPGNQITVLYREKGPPKALWAFFFLCSFNTGSDIVKLRCAGERERNAE